MAKNFIMQFGSGNPATNTGLSPTFTVFKVVPGGGSPTGASAAPGITEIPSATGLYYFSYLPLTSVAFVIDGGAGLAASDRYIVNSIDPIQDVDEVLAVFGDNTLALGNTLLALGATAVALGTTCVSLGESLSLISSEFLPFIGGSASSFGSTSADPETVMGFLKRSQEVQEGNSTFTKSTGVWDVFSRGSSAQLFEKTLTDASGVVSKT
jgi:hypothetical protein